MKQQTINICDSNIAQLGSALEKSVKLEAAHTEKAWKDVGSIVGVRVWRIEDFKVVEIAKSLVGTFYQGDSYIILNTYKDAEGLKLHYDSHFWLGQDTTQDESGTAAYKTVELDDFLLGAATQHRELQGSESALFLSYFKHFVVILGGVASGFHHVGAKVYESRLFWICGNSAKTLSVRQIPADLKEINDEDVFVLDTGLLIYQMNGLHSNAQERHKAAEFSHGIASDRSGSKVEVFEQSDRDAAPFFNGIGAQVPAVVPKKVAAKVPPPMERKLFRVSDSAGPLEISEIASGPVIQKSLLTSSDVYILNNGRAVYVYVGSKASSQEKKGGLQLALDYLNHAMLPRTTPVSRILEGAENADFYGSLATIKA